MGNAVYIIPALGGQKSKDQEFEVSLDCRVRWRKARVSEWGPILLKNKNGRRGLLMHPCTKSWCSKSQCSIDTGAAASRSLMPITVSHQASQGVMSNPWDLWPHRNGQSISFSLSTRFSQVKSSWVVSTLCYGSIKSWIHKAWFLRHLCLSFRSA